MSASLSSSLVEGKELQRVRLYRERKTIHRWDVFPFVLLYGAWLFYHGRPVLLGDKEASGAGFAKLQLGGLAVLHALLYLFSVWSMDVRCWVRYHRCRRLRDASLVKVVPHAFTGSSGVVPLERSTVDGLPHLTFSFRKLRFVWDQQAGVFRKLSYPTKLTFGEYRASSGYGREAEVEAALERWGANRFEVPVPTFWALLQEQLVAPFFCFQVFCVALWALDEFWYYSVFTLFMLVGFESTTVFTRLQNLSAVRALQHPHKPLKVYRCGRWVDLPGEALVPGDVVSLARAQGGEEVAVQADVLLLAGSCIVDEAVLTGESTPQWKNPVGEATGDEVDAAELEPTARLSVKRDKAHVVFGGTKLMQATGDRDAHIRTPDGGCLAVVLRTGFGTAQGRLMRTILYSTERVTANNAETFLFILFLLGWAVAASAYVLREGLADPDRDRFKLFLNCVMILTSVVPPELPMELTIAVNASLMALARAKVFCTEPFRIPMAGKVTTCCFDKTGTLTTDQMELEGVAGLKGYEDDLAQDARQLPAETLRVLACCQSLVTVERSLVGDPVEKASIKAAGWACRGDGVAGPTPAGRESAQIMHRFHFSSVLKRMSTVVKAELPPGAAGATTAWFVLSKGAPEVMAERLEEVPPHYEACYKREAAAGGRVLALAYKPLPKDMTATELRHTPRDEAERGLRFAGFAVFRSPLKPDSEPALRELRGSGHQLVMITGDAPLTACHAAAQVHIVTRAPLILTVAARGAGAAGGARAGALTWRSPDESVEEPFDPDPAAAWQLSQEYDLCATGDGLVALQEGAAARTYIPLIQVFARVTPEQKELVVKTLRADGLVVLMCGDGTNDVGALKGAHVGVALLPPPPEQAAGGQGAAASPPAPPPAASPAGRGGGRGVRGGRGGGPDLPPRGSGGRAPAAAPPPPPAPLKLGAKMLDDMRRRNKPIGPFMERLARQMDEASSGANDGTVPMVRPGDASMASPFTARESSVMPCLDILRQGRCTLVTTVQMFKILGLLSLSTAYSLSVLYLAGIKLGDMQATMAGVLTAGMFFFISHAKPLPKLSRRRPHPNIFSRYVFTSLLGQFAVHMAFLMHMQRQAHGLMLPEDRQLPDAEFKPNLLNTACFLANFAIQTCTFAVNYVGRPFNTPLAENVMFAGSVRWSVAAFVLLSTDVVPGLTHWFSLVAMPLGMKAQMVGFGFLVFVVCTCIERGAREAFPAALPPERGSLRGLAAGAQRRRGD